jgi:hypothetical protein
MLFEPNFIGAIRSFLSMYFVQLRIAGGGRGTGPSSERSSERKGSNCKAKPEQPKELEAGEARVRSKISEEGCRA